MTLVVETGAGIATADTFQSRDAFKALCDKYGWAYSDDDTAIDQALRRSAKHLSESFGWQGYPVKPRTHATPQALAWPRHNVVDKDGYSVSYTAIPAEIIEAQAVMAVREIAEPGAFAAEFRASEVVKKEDFDGVMFEYETRGGGVSDAVLTLSDVMSRIGQFLASGSVSGAPVFGKAVRA